MNTIRAHWVRNNNFGDVLTPQIVRHLAGRDPVWVELNAPVEHFFVVGSTLHLATARTIVWGTGIIRWENETSPDPSAKVAMTRGPLSYSFAAAHGLKCPAVWGDPVAFVREIYPPAQTKAGKWCFVPHFREAEIQIEGVTVLSTSTPPDEFCRVLTSHEYVLSSSLHGLVAAHAYGLKAAWVKLSDKPVGDDTKYRDYLLSQDLNPEPLRLEKLDYATIERQTNRLAAADPDLDAMRRLCPFARS